MNQTTLDTLTKAGMDDKTAEMYLILAENGESTVPQILEHTALSRATVYDVLPQLLAEDFIEYRKDGRVAYYRAVHPTKLLELLDQKKRQLALLEEEMNETVRQVVGSFQLANSKPGVRFFEGVEGVKEAFAFVASNFKKEEKLLSFVKVKSTQEETEFNEAIHNFVKKRIAAGVSTFVLAIDTPEGRNLQLQDTKSLRETRLVSVDDIKLDFPGGELFIYENDICTLTIENGKYFAFTISNPAMAQMLRTFFYAQWIAKS